MEDADVVVLHRVVCCYRDYERLLTAAGSHARQLLVFLPPPRNLLTRIAVSGRDTLAPAPAPKRLPRVCAPPQAMIEVLQAQGLTQRYHHHGTVWDVAGLER